MIKVLVVDDHDLVRTGITRMLADIEGLQVVGQADCGEDCLKLARELKPDVVLMDVKMPGIGGLEATRKLLRSQPDIKVVVVTVCEEDPFPTRLMQAGAAGYMTKGAGLEEMVQAIRQVFAGQRYISPQIAQQLPQGAEHLRQAVPVAEDREYLSLPHLREALDHQRRGAGAARRPPRHGRCRQLDERRFRRERLPRYL